MLQKCIMGTNLNISHAKIISWSMKLPLRIKSIMRNGSPKKGNLLNIKRRFATRMNMLQGLIVTTMLKFQAVPTSPSWQILLRQCLKKGKYMLHFKQAGWLMTLIDKKSHHWKSKRSVHSFKPSINCRDENLAHAHEPHLWVWRLLCCN